MGTVITTKVHQIKDKVRAIIRDDDSLTETHSYKRIAKVATLAVALGLTLIVSMWFIHYVVHFR